LLSSLLRYRFHFLFAHLLALVTLSISPAARLIGGRSSSREIVLRLAFALVLFEAVVLSPRLAQAYPRMIRRDYTGCATCHVDPSGGDVLTEYGAAQAPRYYP
jgi:hypothetical protein